jgi:hypothetical protein
MDRHEPLFRAVASDVACDVTDEREHLNASPREAAMTAFHFAFPKPGGVGSVSKVELDPFSLERRGYTRKVLCLGR